MPSARVMVDVVPPDSASPCMLSITVTQLVPLQDSVVGQLRAQAVLLSHEQFCPQRMSGVILVVTTRKESKG